MLSNLGSIISPCVSFFPFRLICTHLLGVSHISTLVHISKPLCIRSHWSEPLPVSVYLGECLLTFKTLLRQQFYEHFPNLQYPLLPPHTFLCPFNRCYWYLTHIPWDYPRNHLETKWAIPVHVYGFISQAFLSWLEGFLWPQEHVISTWGRQKCQGVNASEATFNQWATGIHWWTPQLPCSTMGQFRRLPSTCLRGLSGGLSPSCPQCSPTDQYTPHWLLLPHCFTFSLPHCASLVTSQINECHPHPYFKVYFWGKSVQTSMILSSLCVVSVSVCLG